MRLIVFDPTTVVLIIIAAIVVVLMAIGFIIELRKGPPL